MDLRSKLARLTRPPQEAALPPDEREDIASEPANDTRAEKLAELRALIGGVAAREKRKAERAGNEPRPRGPLLPWPAIATEHGPLHVIDRYLDVDHHHGRVAVKSALAHSASTIASLTLEPNVAPLDLSRMLFLDTETTGLSGGTGTVAFLVGLAYFEDGVLRIEQLILPTLGAESPMLARVAERIRHASCLVTYNGKAFDWPLLRTRFVLCRMAAPPLPPHIDLLHTTRRVWKARLGSVRLTEIEREVLRFEREGDIDGSEIPARYFEYLRDGGTERLLPVIEHNQNDLIALAAMLGRLAGHFETADAGGEPQDALAFAKLCARTNDSARALTFARAALDGSATRELSRAALEVTSKVQRGEGDVRAAVGALEEALAFARTHAEAAPLHFALAKLYEHGLRDAARAHVHARHTEPHEGPLAQGKRLGRLWRRLERDAQRARVVE